MPLTGAFYYARRNQETEHERLRRHAAYENAQHDAYSELVRLPFEMYINTLQDAHVKHWSTIPGSYNHSFFEAGYKSG